MKPSTWVSMPFGAVLAAVLLITVSSGPGLDGAARSTAIVFWFLPAIVWLGYMSITRLGETGYSRLKKIVVLLLWLIPSLPLSVMSLYGIMLLSEAGLGILF